MNANQPLQNNSQVVPSTHQNVAGPDSAQIANGSLTAGGMRGIGLVAFLIAQITLKLETVKLAKDYYKTSKKDFDFFKSTHEPGAQQSVSEAMSEITNPKYTADLYASSPAGMSTSKKVDAQWFAVRRRMHRYATGAQKRVDYDMSQVRMAAIASGWNMGRRYEMAWTDAHNERRFNRKLTMANVGIGVGNIVRQGLSTAVGKLADAQGEVANTVASIGNGYFKKAGYEDARKETRARYGANTENNQ